MLGSLMPDMLRRIRRRNGPQQSEPQNEQEDFQPGVRLSVIVRCAKCDKANRVARENARKRPICGGCKRQLVPQGAVTFCVSATQDLNDPVFSREISKARGNYEGSWDVIARAFDRPTLPNKVVN